MDLTKIYGKYYFKEEDDSEFNNEFFLNLFSNEDDKIKFDLEMITNGDFGKIGKTWTGTGVFRLDHFAMIIEKELDWIIMTKDKDLTVNENVYFKTLPIEIYPYEKKLILYHKKIDKQLHFTKVEPNKK